jgi:hypothetical protein
VLLTEGSMDLFSEGVADWELGDSIIVCPSINPEIRFKEEALATMASSGASCADGDGSIPFFFDL